MNNIMTNQHYPLNSIANGLNNQQFPITKNYQSMINYIDNLFTRHSRLLVIRIDLGYRKDIDTPFLNEEEIYQKYCQAKVDREHLFRNMRSNALFNHMVGYIWRLEYGEDKGFHNHMIFFYDGSQVQQDVTIGRMIGEYWVNVITQGRGLYYNCNAYKDDYQYCGIGMINHYDMQLIVNLKLAAQYLAKPDDYMTAYMQNMEIGRTFGRGILRVKTENRGRPRKLIYPELGLNPSPEVTVNYPYNF
jgi:hypothetical protein